MKKAITLKKKGRLACSSLPYSADLDIENNNF